MPQSQMPLYNGLAPGLDSNQRIDSIAFTANVVAKTADYTVLATESGTIFTTEGTTANVNFTLPAAADGLVFWFFNAEDFNLTVTADTADTLIAFNDIAADSVAYSTSSEKIGNGFMVFSDGSKWMAMCLPGQDSATVTIAT